MSSNLQSHTDVLPVTKGLIDRGMAQLLRRETSFFEPPRSGFTRVQFPVKVKL